MPIDSPVVTEMRVIPVAGYDSMLLTLSGAHAPFFTRNLVLLTDSSGNSGVGEIHGGEHTRMELERVIPLVVGQPIVKYRAILQNIFRFNRGRQSEGDGEGIQKLNISNLKYVVRSEGAIEIALLDLLGKFLGMPMCALLANGQQRNSIPVLGYLFYVGDSSRTRQQFSYRDEQNSDDPWFRMRGREALTPEAIVLQAETLQAKYGFRDFKLKGGVLPCREELEAVKKLKRRFPEARINIDPNGAWNLQEAVDACLEAKWALSYAEDPVGPEAGFSSREIHAEFKMATGIPVATNMFSVNFRQLYHSLIQKSVDIVLADPHFWTMSGSLRVAQDLSDWGLTWGIHSNNHFDITLAAFVRCAAAAPGKITAIDTHYIWQDGQYLTHNPLLIQNGSIQVPSAPGLGVEVNLEAVEQANRLYCAIPSCFRDRNDAIAMQYLVPNWVYDSKRPCLVR